MGIGWEKTRAICEEIWIDPGANAAFGMGHYQAARMASALTTCSGRPEKL